MNEKQTSESIAASNELIQWLQLLVLPTWVRFSLLGIMGLIFAGGSALLVIGLYSGKKEYFATVVPLFTVALPIMLIVIAIVFGQKGEKRLMDLTVKLLEEEIPRAVEINLLTSGNSPKISFRRYGCRCDYHFELGAKGDFSQINLDFSIELNVKKVNLAFWLESIKLPNKITPEIEELLPFRHVITGAIAEGYRLNDTPLFFLSANKENGLLFFKELNPNFLLKSIDRLYFCQDLSFFVRGIVESLCMFNTISKIEK
jgi:hypothetical protein